MDDNSRVECVDKEAENAKDCDLISQKSEIIENAILKNSTDYDDYSQTKHDDNDKAYTGTSASFSLSQKKTREERKKEREKKREEDMLKKYQIEQEAKQKPCAISKCSRFIKFNLKLGEGGYKFVYRGYDKQRTMNIAWCEYKKETVDTKEKRQAMFKETEIMLKLDHPHIVRCFDVFHEWVNTEDSNTSIDAKGLVVIQEIMNEGTLKFMIRKNFQDGRCILKFSLITRWWYQILDALCYMHVKMKPPILHRDLKAENCFLYNQPEEEYLSVKVGDFGLATHVSSTSCRKTMLGTVGFMAPEIFDEKYDESVDIYAFGMLMLEVMTNRTPYDECLTLMQVAAKTMAGRGPDVLQNVEHLVIKEIIMACIHPLSCYRPTVEELFHHPLFQVKPHPVEVEPNYDKESDRSEVIQRFIKSLNEEEKNPKFLLRLRFHDKRMQQQLGLDDGEALEFHLDIYKAVDQDIPDLINSLRTEYEGVLSQVFDGKNVIPQLDRLFNNIRFQMQFLVKTLLGLRWSDILNSVVEEEEKEEGESNDIDDGPGNTFATISKYKMRWAKAKRMFEREIQAYRQEDPVEGQKHPEMNSLNKIFTGKSSTTISSNTQASSTHAEVGRGSSGVHKICISENNPSIHPGMDQPVMQPSPALHPKMGLPGATSSPIPSPAASPFNIPQMYHSTISFSRQTPPPIAIHPNTPGLGGYPAQPNLPQSAQFYPALIGQGSVPIIYPTLPSTSTGMVPRPMVPMPHFIPPPPAKPEEASASPGPPIDSTNMDAIVTKTAPISRETKASSIPADVALHPNVTCINQDLAFPEAQLSPSIKSEDGFNIQTGIGLWLHDDPNNPGGTKNENKRVRKKSRSSMGREKYLLRLTDIQREPAGADAGTLRLTFFTQMPDERTNDGPHGTWKLTFRCNLSDTTDDFSIPSFYGPGVPPRDNAEVFRSLKDTVLVMMQKLKEDLSSVPLNEDYVFHPFVATLERHRSDSCSVSSPAVHCPALNNDVKTAEEDTSSMVSNGTASQNFTTAPIYVAKVTSSNLSPSSAGVINVMAENPGMSPQSFNAMSESLMNPLFIQTEGNPVDFISGGPRADVVQNQCPSFLSSVENCEPENNQKNLQPTNNTDENCEAQSPHSRSNSPHRLYKIRFADCSNPFHGGVPTRHAHLSPIPHRSHYSNIPSPDTPTYSTTFDETEPFSMSPDMAVPLGFSLVDTENTKLTSPPVQTKESTVKTVNKKAKTTPDKTEVPLKPPEKDSLVDVKFKIPSALKEVVKDLVDKVVQKDKRAIVVVPPVQQSNQKPRILEVPDNHLFVGVPKSKSSGYSVIKGPKENAFVVAREYLSTDESTPRIYQAPKDGAIILDSDGHVTYVDNPSIIIPGLQDHECATHVEELPCVGAIEEGNLTFDNVIEIMHSLKRMRKVSRSRYGSNSQEEAYDSPQPQNGGSEAAGLVTSAKADVSVNQQACKASPSRKETNIQVKSTEKKSDNNNETATKFPYTSTPSVPSGKPVDGCISPSISPNQHGLASQIPMNSFNLVSLPGANQTRPAFVPGMQTYYAPQMVPPGMNPAMFPTAMPMYYIPGYGQQPPQFFQANMYPPNTSPGSANLSIPITRAQSQPVESGVKMATIQSNLTFKGSPPLDMDLTASEQTPHTATYNKTPDPALEEKTSRFLVQPVLEKRRSSIRPSGSESIISRLSQERLSDERRLHTPINSPSDESLTMLSRLSSKSLKKKSNSKLATQSTPLNNQEDKTKSINENNNNICTHFSSYVPNISTLIASSSSSHSDTLPISTTPFKHYSFVDTSHLCDNNNQLHTSLPSSSSAQQIVAGRFVISAVDTESFSQSNQS